MLPVLPLELLHELDERIHTGILTQLPGVVRVQSTLALRTVKKTTALPV